MQINDTPKKPAATNVRYLDFEKSLHAATMSITNNASPPNMDNVEKNLANWNALSVGKNSGYSTHVVGPMAFKSSKNQIPAPTVSLAEVVVVMLLSSSTIVVEPVMSRNWQPPDTAMVKKRATPDSIPGSACMPP